MSYLTIDTTPTSIIVDGTPHVLRKARFAHLDEILGEFAPDSILPHDWNNKRGAEALKAWPALDTDSLYDELVRNGFES